MIRATPEDFVRPAADALAQIMLQCASDDPSLVRRSRGHGKSAQIQAKLLPAVQRETGSPFTLLSNSDRATRQYLEDLASIAGASAERADDVLLQAKATRRRANRAVWAFASVAAVRVVVGAAGVVSSCSGNETGVRIPEIAGEVRSLGAQQQLTDHQLVDVRSDVTGEQEAVAAVQQTVTPARPDSESASRDGAAGGRSSATSAIATAPVSPVQQASYSSSVWPQRTQPEQPTTYSSPLPQHTQQAGSARHRPQETIRQS